MSWRELDAELDRWRDGGQVADFWWRDDDAAKPSAPLARLLELSQSSRDPPPSVTVNASFRSGISQRRWARLPCIETVNGAPAVNITAPANNAVFTTPATITVTATAADTDGTVAKVDFFDGAIPVGTAKSRLHNALALLREDGRTRRYFGRD